MLRVDVLVHGPGQQVSLPVLVDLAIGSDHLDDPECDRAATYVDDYRVGQDFGHLDRDSSSRHPLRVENIRLLAGLTYRDDHRGSKPSRRPLLDDALQGRRCYAWLQASDTNPGYPNGYLML